MGARNGYGALAPGAAQQNGRAGNGQAATDQSTQQAIDATEAAKQAADALLHTLATTADDAKEAVILDALPALAPLDTIAWMQLKKQLKTAVPSLNMNDLAQANTGAHAALHDGGGGKRRERSGTAGADQAALGAVQIRAWAG
jgi:hypothetical protein